MRSSPLGYFGLLASLLVAACSNTMADADDARNTGGKPGAGVGGATEMAGMSGRSGVGGATEMAGMSGVSGTSNTYSMAGSGMTAATGVGGMSSSGGMANMAGMSSQRTFKLRIENVSADAPMATPFAPGAYAIVNGNGSPFSNGMSATSGLEMAAEDANPLQLFAEAMAETGVASTGVFNTPVGASAAGPAFPGSAYEITFSAKPAQILHFASMFGQSNDVYVTAASGIALFDHDGMPRSGDVTPQVALWDAGSERDEAPGMGPNQAPRQAAPNSGPTESGVSLRLDGTRSLPIPSALVDVTVSLSGGTYAIALQNRSGKGPVMSPLSPVFYAAHDGAYRYLTPGAAASPGLERLAEDGNASVLVAEATQAGAMAGIAGAAAFGPGSAVTFNVTPTATLRLLSLAMMIGQTNDAFIGTRPEAIQLLDASNLPRSAALVQSDIARLLATWDAGTEANQAPGVGPNQAPRQTAPNTGPSDPDSRVRIYADSTNDLSHLGNLLEVSITHGTGNTFDVMVANKSGNSVFPLVVSPVAWATHSAQFAAFTLGSMSSPGLERLAEDGNAASLIAEWATSNELTQSGVAGTAPFAAGQSVSFQVTPDLEHRFLTLAAMLVPSNDTFAALGPKGIALLDAMGNPRNDDGIAEDVRMNLAAYESGTEANQGSALGPDMAPYQVGPNTGAPEGPGRSRPVDGVWPFPPVSQLLKVTLTPM